MLDPTARARREMRERDTRVIGREGQEGGGRAGRAGVEVRVISHADPHEHNQHRSRALCYELTIW